MYFRTATFLGALACWLAIACQASLAAGPDMRWLRPAGGQRGTTVEVTAGGKFDAWGVSAWVNRPGVAVSAAEEKGKLSIAIAPDAAPGLCWVRLYDAQGASDPKPFVVGTLADVVDSEPNDALDAAQTIDDARTVASGCLQRRGDVDHYAVTLRQGETLVASLGGHELLGSPMDAVLHVVSPGGFQLAYNHDCRGLDPEIVFAAPTDGRYLVRALAFPSKPNSSIAYAGGDDYLYRLTLTTGGFVDYAWPLAVTRGRETSVELFGWNIPESLRTVSIVPVGTAHEIADAQLANVGLVAVEPHDTAMESEPNSPEAPGELTLPQTISGRIDRPGDVDAFRFAATKDQPLVFELASRRLGYPLDGVLEVTDATGKSLAKVDDQGGQRDPLVNFTPPADGEYRLLVRDLNRQGSPRHVYRLRAVPATASFEVSADKLAYTVSKEQPAEMTLAIDRQHGFNEEIQFTVAGLPEAITAAPAVSSASGDTAKSVKLSLTTSGAAFSGPIRVVARSTGPTQLERSATAPVGEHPARLAELWLTAIAPAEPKQ